jgi:hypothetical protein
MCRYLHMIATGAVEIAGHWVVRAVIGQDLLYAKNNAALI